MPEHQLVVVREGPEAEQEYLLPTLLMSHYPSSAVEMAIPEPLGNLKSRQGESTEECIYMVFESMVQ